MTGKGLGDVARTFDDWAARGRAEGMERGHRRTAGDLINGMPIKAGDRFLDLGTGNGWACRDAAAQGAFAVGVDIAAAMVKRAADSSTDGRTAFLQGAFDALPFANDAFQHAWSMEALYYAPDLAAALKETARVLEPGGRLASLVDHYAENEASHSWSTDVGVAMHLLSVADWAKAFEAAGFEDVQTSMMRAERPADGKDDDEDAWKWLQGSLLVSGRAP